MQRRNESLQDIKFRDGRPPTLRSQEGMLETRRIPIAIFLCHTCHTLQVIFGTCITLHGDIFSSTKQKTNADLRYLPHEKLSKNS